MMDLGAYAQIDDLEHIMEENGISVPRLRGLRLMKDTESLSKDDMADMAHAIGVDRCEMVCQADFLMNSWAYELSARTDRIIDKYMVKDEDGYVTDIKWDKVHGFRRKIFKYTLRKAKKRVKAQYDVWNKYAGRDDVLYIHARIGGDNWDYYGGDELRKRPWFLEKVDDAYDRTYCDIYARIEKEQEHEYFDSRDGNS